MQSQQRVHPLATYCSVLQQPVIELLVSGAVHQRSGKVLAYGLLFHHVGVRYWLVSQTLKETAIRRL